MADNEQSGSDNADVVLMVCMTCGREVQFEGDETPSPDMKCEKCGSQVFRRFDDSGSPDEASQDFRDTTDRDTDTDDPADDSTSQDLLDLNNP